MLPALYLNEKIHLLAVTFEHLFDVYCSREPDGQRASFRENDGTKASEHPAGTELPSE